MCGVSLFTASALVRLQWLNQISMDWTMKQPSGEPATAASAILVSKHYLFYSCRHVAYEIVRRTHQNASFSQVRLHNLQMNFSSGWQLAEKRTSLVLQRQWFLRLEHSFQLWPRVVRSSALWKKNDQETAVRPFTILNISIKSALFRRFSKDHTPSWRSLSSYDIVDSYQVRSDINL